MLERVTLPLDVFLHEMSSFQCHTCILYFKKSVKFCSSFTPHNPCNPLDNYLQCTCDSRATALTKFLHHYLIQEHMSSSSHTTTFLQPKPSAKSQHLTLLTHIAHLK